MKKHRVVVYNWVEGRLRFEEKFLESLEHALEFIKNLICHDVKVYDEEGKLVEVGKHKDQDDTYA